MTRLETLKNRLHDVVCDKNAKMADFRELCAELFNEMGGELILRALKKDYLRESRKGMDGDMDKLFELKTEIDEMERYKEYSRA